MASIDNTTEIPTIATELVTDPAAPASGPGAGANEGLRSWAEATVAAKMMTKKKEKNFIADDAIAKLWNRRLKMKIENIKRS
ncbi:uncharacterized protein [Medicago truncatula]|uniref:Uncharacterized protein n=1 Tax=Medicago truncatula TaxID=3880 RepID=G7IZF3_MEDTR|nr:uncharacterized protein LOC112419942 [Medicago truncatula]AFK47196.1 unknown [Medicago truncatula]